MSEPVSALNGAFFDGLVTVREAGLQGMITLRGDLSSDALGTALRDAAGQDMPDRRRADQSDDFGALWMSPDEVLILCPYDQSAQKAAALRDALTGRHALVADVSDARAMFSLTGEEADVREVLARLAPADLHPDAFGPGELRRTRLAQVSAAFWLPEAGVARVVCFRSVARYVMGLLENAADPAARAGLFDPRRAH